MLLSSKTPGVKFEHLPKQKRAVSILFETAPFLFLLAFVYPGQYTDYDYRRNTNYADKKSKILAVGKPPRNKNFAQDIAFGAAVNQF